MATEILEVSADAANSDDVVVVDGEQLAVCLKDAAGPTVSSAARVDIQLKDDAGEYFTIASLRGRTPYAVLNAGTYRFSRVEGVSCGVFSTAAPEA